MSRAQSTEKARVIGRAAVPILRGIKMNKKKMPER